MHLKHRTGVMFVMVIVAMTGLSACGEEQGTATNLSAMNQHLTQTASMQNTTVSIRQKEQLNMWMTVNGHRFEVVLEDNATAQAFVAQLPLTLHMEELNGNEKHGQLSGTLPIDEKRPGIIHNGDLMLYGSSTLVVFYKTFPSAYSYTRIGRINQPDELADILERGSIHIEFSRD